MRVFSPYSSERPICEVGDEKNSILGGLMFCGGDVVSGVSAFVTRGFFRGRRGRPSDGSRSGCAPYPSLCRSREARIPSRKLRRSASIHHRCGVARSFRFPIGCSGGFRFRRSCRSGHCGRRRYDPAAKGRSRHDLSQFARRETTQS